MIFKRRLFLTAATTCILLAILPGSRWLVRLQAIPGYSEEADVKAWRQQNQEAAAQQPDDFALQFALSLQKEEGSDENAEEDHRGFAEAQSLWALRTRFPNEPALYAAVLRYLTYSELRLGCPEQDLLLSKKRRTEYAVSRFQNPERFFQTEANPESLALFRDAAEAGARLDPQNSFFPLMQAMERFCSTDDGAALAAFHRAAEDTKWNDYVSDETDARERLCLAAYGPTGFLERLEGTVIVSYPHLPQLRAASRLAVALAVQKELTGDREGGWVIRRDVARCGVVLRCTSTSIVGSEVGSTVSQTAHIRPGGQEMPASIDGAEEEGERSRWRLEQFVTYANANGHPEAAEEAVRQEAASTEVESIEKGTQDRGFFSNERLCRVITARAVGSALLTDVLVVLVFGAVAFGFSRTPRVRDGRGLHAAIRWALVALVTTIPGYLIGSVYRDAEGARWGAIGGVLAVNFAAIGTFAFGPNKRRNITIFLVSLPAISISVIAALLAVFSVFRLVEASPWTHGLGAFYVPNDPNMFVHTQAILALSVLLPLLWIFGLMLWSLFRRESVSSGTVRGAAKTALTFASILLFAYAALVPVTLGIERQAVEELTESRQHEGRYYARLAGRPWPVLPVTGSFLGK